MITSALVAGFAVVCVGGVLLWSNPRRSVNRVVFTCSLNIAAWLFLLHWALSSGRENGLYWLRWASAVGALMPLHFWLVKEAIASDFEELSVKRVLGWVIFDLFLFFLPFTDFYIPAHSTHESRVYGWGYYAFISGSLAFYLALGFDVRSRVRRLVGGRRLALQVWLVGGCLAAVTILILMAVNAVTHDPRFIRLQPFVVLMHYVATSYAVTAYRVFDARQLLRLGIEKAILVVLVAGIAWLCDSAISMVLPEPFALFVTTGLALVVASKLGRWLDTIFHFFPEATVARQTLFSIAGRGLGRSDLESSFLSVLRGWGQSENALIWASERVAADRPVVGGVDLKIVSALKEMRWVTPERLAREREHPGSLRLVDFLDIHKLGVAVVAEGPSLDLVVGVGGAASRRPFTYPQVVQLQELAAIIETAYSRSFLTDKMQRAEQLASVGLMGAGLAHEIRNPLVSIKAFVQLLPECHADPHFRQRFSEIVGAEVMRIDRLTEQLMELAAPKNYTRRAVSINEAVKSVSATAASRAEVAKVALDIRVSDQPLLVWSDPDAVRQVLLNLLINGVQAQEKSEGARWVKVTVIAQSPNIEIEVADNGPGIPEAQRPNLFQPFRSTKSSGFGLGLAICRDILAKLDASISLDPYKPGGGAVFRVVFPCPPPTS